MSCHGSEFRQAQQQSAASRHNGNAKNRTIGPTSTELATTKDNTAGQQRPARMASQTSNHRSD